MGVISNGTTLLDAGALDSGVATGTLILISTATPSDVATLDITSGIDSTYQNYIISVLNVHPATDDVSFQFQADTGTNTNFNTSVTSTHWRSTNGEDGSSPGTSYLTGGDQAGTGFHTLAGSIGNDNDQGVSGTIQIFDPSDTTYVKHFLFNMQSIAHSNRTNFTNGNGYFNTTTAITRFRFKFSSGNIGSGTVKLYGIKNS